MTVENWVNQIADVPFSTRQPPSSHGATERPETPFFVYLALSAPHSPHLVPELAAGKS